ADEHGVVGARHGAAQRVGQHEAGVEPVLDLVVRALGAEPAGWNRHGRDHEGPPAVALERIEIVEERERALDDWGRGFDGHGCRGCAGPEPYRQHREDAEEKDEASEHDHAPAEEPTDARDTLARETSFRGRPLSWRRPSAYRGSVPTER